MEGKNTLDSFLVSAHKNKMNQTTTIILTPNEKSWKRSLFYDPALSETVEDWLFNVKPSTCITTSSCKSIVVLHPTLNVSEYKKEKHRDGFSVPEDIKKEISSKKSTIPHARLLTMAANCNTFQGFWFLSCKKNKWDYYFEKIVVELYCNNASSQIKGYQFEKIEARWSHGEDMGVIMISQPNFTNVDLVIESGEIIKKLINRKDVRKGHVRRCLSYKPQFYLESGFDQKFSHNLNANIYSRNLTLDRTHQFRYCEEAEIWVKNHFERIASNNYD